MQRRVVRFASLLTMCVFSLQTASAQRATFESSRAPSPGISWSSNPSVPVVPITMPSPRWPTAPSPYTFQSPFAIPSYPPIPAFPANSVSQADIPSTRTRVRTTRSSSSSRTAQTYSSKARYIPSEPLFRPFNNGDYSSQKSGIIECNKFENGKRRYPDPTPAVATIH